MTGIASGDSVPKLAVTFGNGRFISKSPLMLAVLDLARAAAQSPRISVLLLGESGTGKGLLAREVHASSARAGGPFIAVNCGAQNANMIEDELFGHEKGAFTGAVATKAGVFERANGGAIFLDEIGDLFMDLQVKLFGVLDNLLVTRLGGTREIPIDVRVISATNHDLRLAIRKGKFRPELYHRINTLPISIPPLRERREDILLLTLHFLARFGTERIPAVTSITPAVETVFERYYWPGNVRELEHVIERMVATSSTDQLTVESLPANLIQSNPFTGHPFGFRAARLDLTESDIQLLKSALRRNKGVKSRAARELGITRGQLDYRLKLIGQLDRQ